MELYIKCLFCLFFVFDDVLVVSYYMNVIWFCGVSDMFYDSMVFGFVAT